MKLREVFSTGDVYYFSSDATVCKASKHVEVSAYILFVSKLTWNESVVSHSEQIPYASIIGA